jgi:serine/threonine protein kinase
MSDLIGKEVGRYLIFENVGEGGMATVYKAYDARLEREVALKIIRPEAFPPDQLQNILVRFEREAKALAKLSHPNIVNVYDYGDFEGSPYLVLEYLPGGTLKQSLADRDGKPVPWKEAAHTLQPIMEALSFAHAHGLVHRDVKPSNLLITNTGRLMLSDFGIAKLLGTDDSAALTGSGGGIGTPEYMAPEQWTGDVSAQSDLYSLGVILYEMVTGRKPYEAETPAGVLIKQATQPLPPPRNFATGLPTGLEDVLKKALAPRPEDRYKTVDEFSRALVKLEKSPRTKNEPEKNLDLPSAPETASEEDETEMRTADQISVGALKGADLKNTGKTAPGNKKPQNRKRSGRGVWVTLAILAGLLLLAGGGYEASTHNLIPAAWTAWLHVPTPAATATMQVALVTSPTLPVPTLEATEAPPTNTAPTTPTAIPKPTQIIITRKTITVENANGLVDPDHINITSSLQLAWDKENRYLVVASPNAVDWFDSVHFQSMGHQAIPVRDQIYLSEDGSRVGFFETGVTFKIMSLPEYVEIKTLDIPEQNGSIHAVAFSQDDQYVAMGTSTGMINVYQIAENKITSSFDSNTASFITTLQFNKPDKNQLASGSGTSSSMDNALRLWSLPADITPKCCGSHEATIIFLFYTKDGNLLVSASEDGWIYEYRVSDFVTQRKIEAYMVKKDAKIQIQSMAVNPSGDLMAYGIPVINGNALVLTKFNGDHLLTSPTRTNPFTHMAFSVDNTALATADETGISIWSVK